VAPGCSFDYPDDFSEMTEQAVWHYWKEGRPLCMTFSRAKGLKYKVTLDLKKVTCKSCQKCITKISNSRPA
jgi:hypothetical protein